MGGSFPVDADLAQIGPQSWPCANPPWLATSPIQWKPINESSGNIDFYVERSRSNLQFVLFGNGTTYPVVLGKSNILSFSDLHQPQHVHIAHGNDPGSLRIMWSALDLDATASIHLGTEKDKYDTKVLALPHTYDRNDLCGPPANAHGFYEVPWFYSGIVSDLKPGQKYYYRVGSEENERLSKEFSFVGPKAPGRNTILQITALADLGETYVDGSQYHWMEPFAINSTTFANQTIGPVNLSPKVHPWKTEGTTPLTMTPHPKEGNVFPDIQSGKEAPPSGHVLGHIKTSLTRTNGLSADVVVHIGDLAYATGYETEWDRFMSQIEDIATRVPYMTGQGNHERDYSGSGSAFNGDDSGGECGIPTQARFLMPTPSHRQDNGWYSWEEGPVHFIMMDTEMEAYNKSSQFLFFEEDLAKVNRSTTPFVIFMGHRPMYSSSSSPGGINVGAGAWMPDLEDLLIKYQVDLCLWGHVHNAEYTCPLYRGKCVTPAKSGAYAAPIHAVIGNAGQSLTPYPFDATHPAPVWSKWRYTCPQKGNKCVPQAELNKDGHGFGYSTLTADGIKNTLTLNFFADKENTLLQTFEIAGKH